MALLIGIIANMFNHMVIDNDVEATGLKRQFYAAGYVKLEFSVSCSDVFLVYCSDVTTAFGKVGGYTARPCSNI